MIFFLFYSITTLLLYAMQTSQQTIVLIMRLAEVWCMEEYCKERVEEVP